MSESVRKKPSAWSIVLPVVFVVLFGVGRMYGSELLSLLPGKIHTVEVSEKTVLDESEELTYTIRLPEFTTPDTRVQEFLNDLAKTISDDAFGELETMKQRAVEDAASAKEAGYELPQYDYRVDFEVTYNRDNLLSVNILQYFYTAGAHGMTVLLPHNISLRNGKALALADLFDDARTAQVVLALGVSERIKADPNRYFPDALQTAGVSADRQFYLKEGQIVLHYGLYEIAPYAAGFSEFAFGVDEVGKELKPAIRRSLEREGVQAQ